MLARCFLILVLLVHPARDALASGSGPVQTADCGSACCPLCEMLERCPCQAGPESPAPMPERAPAFDRDAPRLRAADGVVFAVVRASSAAPPRAPPIYSIRSLEPKVGRYLSRLGVWRT
ncbi:MAG: hypothetical protein AAGA55_05725 [Planctomycetota bacterium]